MLLAGIFAFTYCGGNAYAQGGSTSAAGSASFTKTPSLDQITSLLIFPATNQAGDDYRDVAGKLAMAIKLKVNGIGRYHAEGYKATLPAIDRALNVEDSLTSADLTPPFDKPARGAKIAKVVGDDGYVFINLDSAVVDTTNRTVALTATAQVYAVTSADPIETIQVTGKAVSAGVADTLDNVEQRALDSAAGKLVAAISPGFGSNVSATAIPKAAGAHKGGGSKFLAILLLGVAVAVVIAAAHSNSSSSSSTNSGSSNSGGSGGSGGTTLTPPSPPGV